MSIKAVTFDCWGTLLYDLTPAGLMSGRVGILREASDGRLTEEAAAALLEAAWEEHHAAWVAGEHYGSEGMAAFCARELGFDEEWSQRLCALIEDASLNGPVDTLPGALEALKTLRANNIRTALVCDTGFTPGRVVRHLLDAHGLLDHLEFVAFSNEVGVPKPDPRIFKVALDALGVEPSQAAHIGDLRRTDIAGAKALGMFAVQIVAVPKEAVRVKASDAADGPEPDAVIASYDEFVPALRTLGALL